MCYFGDFYVQYTSIAIKMSIYHSEIVPLFPKKKTYIICVNCQADIFSFRQMTI